MPRRCSVCTRPDRADIDHVLVVEQTNLTRADDLLDQVRKLQSRTLALLSTAEQGGDHRVALGAISQARGNVELLAKLLIAAQAAIGTPAGGEGEGRGYTDDAATGLTADEINIAWAAISGVRAGVWPGWGGAGMDELLALAAEELARRTALPRAI